MANCVQESVSGDDVVARLAHGEAIVFGASGSDRVHPASGWFPARIRVVVRPKGRDRVGDPIYYGFACMEGDDADPPAAPLFLGRFEPDPVDAACNLVDLLESIGYVPVASRGLLVPPFRR